MNGTPLTLNKTEVAECAHINHLALEFEPYIA